MKRLKKIFYSLFFLLLVLIAAAVLFMQHPKFGTTPTGDDLARIQKSPNYQQGEFKNVLPTQKFTGNNNVLSTVLNIFFFNNADARPSQIPSIKTDLHSLGEIDTLIWLGHSSYFMQLSGKRILIDPVLSSYAAPLPFLVKAYKGTTIYAAEDFPEIDYVLISHDHWDHLDYPTLVDLQPKIKKIICGLGVGSHLKKWGYKQDQIYEGDWFTTFFLPDDLEIDILPARHFSGRLFDRNQTLWVSFVIHSKNHRIFYSGDSGYSPHFAEIGEQFGGFDLAILENGQYNQQWANVHMMPEEVAQAAEDLKTTFVLPAHSAKFTLSNHAWNEPFQRLESASAEKSYQLLTPMIGEPIILGDHQQKFSQWWKHSATP